MAQKYQFVRMNTSLFKKFLIENDIPFIVEGDYIGVADKRAKDNPDHQFMLGLEYAGWIIDDQIQGGIIKTLLK